MLDKRQELDTLMEDAVKEGVFPGASVVIVSKDGTYLKSYGNKRLVPKLEKNNLDTLYDMASCTKVICTTTAIFLLMERGLVRLYDQVNKYVPEFKYDGIKVFDLLTHSSGLYADVSRANRIKSNEELMDRIFSMDLKYETGTDIVYSDLGFILLGKIIEKISDKSLDAFVKENIFDKLDMHNSGYNPRNKEKCAPTEDRNDEVYQGILQGDVHDEKAYIMNGVAGHAGLFSCVKDLEKFIKMILNDGMHNGQRFLSKASIDLMFRPMVRVEKKVSLDYDQRGLGWIVRGDYPSCGDLASLETIYHTGFTGTNIVIDRINNVGFAILSNRVHPTRNNQKIIAWRGKVGNFIIANFGER